METGTTGMGAYTMTPAEGSYIYEIKKAGTTVFKGKAVATQDAAAVFNVGDVAKDFLFVSVPVLSATTVTQHPDAFGIFSLEADGSEVASWALRDDYSGEPWDGEDSALSGQITDHADPRQMLLYSQFSKTGNTIDIDTGAEYYVYVEPASATVSATQTYLSLTVNSNTDYEIQTSSSWFFVPVTGGTAGTQVIAVVIDRNQTFEDRQGDISFVYYDGVTTCTIKQTAIVPSYSIYPTQMVVNSAVTGGVQFLVNSNVNFSADSPQNWITYSGRSQAGVDTYNVVFDVSNNYGDSRSGTTVFTFQTGVGQTSTISASIQQSGVSNNVLLYTSTNSQAITPNVTTGYGANYVSSTYNEGIGVLYFDGAVTSIPAKAFSGITNLDKIYLPTSITGIGSSAFTDVNYINIFYKGTYSQWQNVSLSDDYIPQSGTVHYKANSKANAQYVYYSPLGTTTINFNFGIPLTTNTKIHFICEGAGYTVGGMFLGCLYTTSDTDDFRYLQPTTTTSYLDWGSQRINGNIGLSVASGSTMNVRLENYKITNVTTGQYLSGVTQSSVPSSNAMLGVRLGYWKVKSVEIYRGDNLVFNMSACTCGNVAGFYDSVSDTFLTAPGLVAEI